MILIVSRSVVLRMRNVSDKSCRECNIQTPILCYISCVFLETSGLSMWRVWVRRGGCIGSCWGNRREGDHWGDLGVDGWIILGWISRRWDVGIWTGLGWSRIGTGGGRL